MRCTFPSASHTDAPSACDDKTETSYQVGEFYTPGSEGGLLYSDPSA